MPDSLQSPSRARGARSVPVAPPEAPPSRFEDLIHDLEAVIWEADAQTLEYTFVSRRVAQILGWSAEDWLQRRRTWPDHVIPEDRAEALAECHEAPSEGRGRQLEYRAATSDGRTVWLRDRIRRVVGADGRERLRGVMLDITQRKEAELMLGVRARQQAAIAELGHSALAGAELPAILREAVRVVSEILAVEYATVMELMPEQGSFVVTAGVGWRPGLEGLACVSSGPETMAGYTLQVDVPVVSEDLREETRFRLTPLFAEHGVISGISVVLRTRLRPFGVLGVHSRQRRSYSPDDVNFLQSVANVLGAAIERMETEQVARDQTAALTRTLDALASKPELDTFLGQVLIAVAEQLGAGTVALWIYDPEETSIAVSMYYDHGSIVQEKRFGKPSSSGPFQVSATPLWIEMVERGRPIFVSDLRGDSRARSREWLLARGMRSMLMVPLLLGDEPIGCFTIGSGDSRGYRPEEVEFAQALAQQATLALQLTRLADQSRQAAILQERNRLAREIHDTLAQGFTGILVQLDAAEDAAGDLQDGCRAHLVRARDLARASLAEARRSVWSLRLHVLEGYDLPGAFTRLVAQMTTGTTVQAKFRVRGAPRPLPPESEGHLLRIGLEALTNALKHAEANLVRLELAYLRETIRLSIRDDGKGFSPGVSMKDGFGLAGMRERAECLGAQLTIDTQPGEGTEVILVVPDPPSLETAA